MRRWRRDQGTILSGELKMSAKRADMGRFTPKYSELDEKVMEWFSQQRDQIFHHHQIFHNVKCEELSEIVFQCVGSKESDWWPKICFVITILKHTAVMEFKVISH